MLADGLKHEKFNIDRPSFKSTSNGAKRLRLLDDSDSQNRLFQEAVRRKSSVKRNEETDGSLQTSTSNEAVDGVDDFVSNLEKMAISQQTLSEIDDSCVWQYMGFKLRGNTVAIEEYWLNLLKPPAQNRRTDNQIADLLKVLLKYTQRVKVRGAQDFSDLS